MLIGKGGGSGPHDTRKVDRKSERMNITFENLLKCVFLFASDIATETPCLAM